MRSRRMRAARVRSFSSPDLLQGFGGEKPQAFANARADLQALGAAPPPGGHAARKRQRKERRWGAFSAEEVGSFFLTSLERHSLLWLWVWLWLWWLFQSMARLRYVELRNVHDTIAGAAGSLLSGRGMRQQPREKTQDRKVMLV